MSDIQEMRFEYWCDLLRLLQQAESRVLTYKRSPFSSTKKATITFGLGRSGAHLWAGLSKKHQRVEVGFMLDGDSAEDNFRKIFRDKQDIEQHLGRLDYAVGTKVRFPVMIAKSTEPFCRLNWHQNQSWMVDNLERFFDVFKPRVASL